MRNSIIERNFLNIPTDRTININRNLKNYSSNNIFDNNNIKIQQNYKSKNSNTKLLFKSSFNNKFKESMLSI